MHLQCILVWIILYEIHWGKGKTNYNFSVGPARNRAISKMRAFWFATSGILSQESVFCGIATTYYFKALFRHSAKWDHVIPKVFWNIDQEILNANEWKHSVPTLILNKCTHLVLLQPACDVIGHSPRIVNNREMGVLQQKSRFQSKFMTTDSILVWNAENWSQIWSYLQLFLATLIALHFTPVSRS